MSFGAAKATSVDLCVRDFVENSRFRQTTCVIGCPVDTPFPGISFVPVRRGSGQSQAAYARALARTVKQVGPDLVVVQQHPATASIIARQLGNMPVLLHRHGLVADYAGFWRQLRYRFLYGRMAHVIWVTEALAQRYRAIFPRLGSRTSTIINGIDLAAWEPAAKEKLIVHAGRAVPEKGVRELVDALAKVLPLHPEWRARFLLAVEPQDAAFVEGLKQRAAPAASQIEWAANVPLDTVRLSLKAAAISVVPSLLREGFNRVAMESHAAGAALISSGMGGLREVSGDAAIYLPEVTGPAIAVELARLMEDNALLYETQERSRQRAIDALDIRATSARLDALYERVLAGSSA